MWCVGVFMHSLPIVILMEWWPGLVGEGTLFDPQKYFIVCAANMPGSAYGSIGPLDTNPVTGEKVLSGVSMVHHGDMIRAYHPLREALGIRKIFLGIGGSMGGQQLLEWAIEEPSLFQHIIPHCYECLSFCMKLLSMLLNGWLLKQMLRGIRKQMKPDWMGWKWHAVSLCFLIVIMMHMV